MMNISDFHMTSNPLYFTGRQPQNLQNDLVISKGAAFAAGTKANLCCQWKAFLMCLITYQLQ